MPTCRPCGFLAVVISSTLSPSAQNRSLQSRETLRSKACGWARGPVDAGQSTLGLVAWPRLPRQLGAFYREAALDEPSAFVHGPHLTAPCGPFAEVA